MKYQLQYKYGVCGDWFLAHEADTSDEVYGYWQDNRDEFIGQHVRIVRITVTVLAELGVVPENG
jgi:hypothetical protein